MSPSGGDPALSVPSPAEARDRTFASEALPEMEAVYRFALRLTHDPDRARDLTQETFLRGWEKWDHYLPGTRARSWLFTIARNLFLRGEDRGRRYDEIVSEIADEDPRGVSRDSTVFLAASDRDPEGTFWDGVVDGEILREIDALPEEFREVIALSDLEGLPYAEIAEVLGLPVGTVKSRLFRARRILQEKLYDYAVASGIVRPRGRTGLRAERGSERGADGGGER